MNKDETVAQVEAIMSSQHPDPSALCLHWAVATRDAIQKRGTRAIIQAGTMMWPRLRHEDDDGVVNTHFSYVWEPDSEITKQRIAARQLPEMHVWCAIPNPPQIIDLTTRFFRQRCERVTGMNWTAPEPPQYLWVTPDTLPQNVVYRPEVSAIRLACYYAFLADGNFQP
jgi:hypothetical protein